MIRFIVYGDPVPKQSFRKSKSGGYTDPRQKTWQDYVTMRTREHWNINELDPLKGSVCVEMMFYLSNNRTCDLDNLSKAILDAMKNIAFGDDTNVTKLLLSKFVDADNPRVEISVTAIQTVGRRE